MMPNAQAGQPRARRELASSRLWRRVELGSEGLAAGGHVSALPSGGSWQCRDDRGVGMSVCVAGGAMTPFNRRKDGSSWRDWCRDAFAGALADAALERSAIDALVVASESDFFTLQLNPASMIADTLGLFG
ncbi:MAG: hypothetical protein F4103_08795, partial [Boseongicola sp. SB0673_bin_14]|nr:hypothetical protein [Boseongicola sp. SB0673_bin_14]